ncbi:MAG: hypothetical protein MR591_01165 [Helicobacter sp.]|uniref:hypothetical protein n=1 Tax=Helicobacter sp. TaxID=218 RepID=UPI00374FF7DF|nr:hypothetical protein [Helicobacter sp.]
MQKRGGIFGVLSAAFGRKADFIPLPYVKNLHALHKCVQCEGKCATSCPEHIIIKNANSTPYLNFMIAGCVFCEQCAHACQELWGDEAPLEIAHTQQLSAIAAKVCIDPLTCLAWQKTPCMSCKDACGENAVMFSGGLYPEIDLGRCSACGLCYARCPSFSIIIKGTLT